MPTGTVKKFFLEKGFGFITPDDGSPDIFAPKRTLIGDESNIREGAKVTFESEMEDRTNKPKASTWSILVGGAGGGAGTSNPWAGLSQMAAMPSAYNALSAYAAMPTAGYGAQGGVYGGVPAGYGAVSGGGMGDARFSPYGAMPATASHSPMQNYGATVQSYPAALPSGWEQVTDPSSGKPYYCNRTTGETSWTPPSAATSPTPAQAATAAAAAPSPTGATMPAAAPATGPSAPATTVPAPGSTAAAPAEPMQILPGWEQGPDPTTGKLYYYNRNTGESSWTPPVAS